MEKNKNVNIPEPKLICCHHCGYLWYTKTQNLYTTCPCCNYKINVEKDMVKDNND